MAGAQDWEGFHRLLNGAFGTLQQAAAQRMDTAAIWQRLRVTTGTTFYQSQGIPLPATDQEIEERGRQILSEQGVGVRQVNAYRGLAGQWLRAKQSLQQLGSEQVVLPQDIFVPPWARTATGEVPSRYRMRVQWNLVDDLGRPSTAWGTYELQSPLTTVGDALAASQNLAGLQPTSDIPPGSVISGVQDFQIEQV